ncbi:MAG: LptA/OstA family protein [Verrucomicrobiota bacterium]
MLALFALAATPVPAQLPDDTDTETQPPIGSTLITSDELHADQVAHTSIFTGHVVVVGQNFHMTCQEMTVDFDNNNKVQKIVAVGDVIIVQPFRVTHCGHAEYYQDVDTFVLTEQPVIHDHQDTIKGPKITVDRKSQKMTVDGGRTTVILPNQSLGSTNAPSGTPPSTP